MGTIELQKEPFDKKGELWQLQMQEQSFPRMRE